MDASGRDLSGLAVARNPVTGTVGIVVGLITEENTTRGRVIGICIDAAAYGYYFYRVYRRFLWRAKISHGGKGCGPRVYDFRHTYAVHCLKKWVEEEKDLTVYLPVLKTYMGHDSFTETAYYLHLTADVFPDITLKMETRYPGIIPESEGDTNEAN